MKAGPTERSWRSFPSLRELSPAGAKEIRLTAEQIEAIKARVPSQKGIPKDTNWKRRLEIEGIQKEARISFSQLRLDPMWVAGTTMYWAEGAKTYPQLSMVNTDPRALRLFIDWVRHFIDPNADFVLALHLHEGNVEADAQAWWRQQLELDRGRLQRLS